MSVRTGGGEGEKDGGRLRITEEKDMSILRTTHTCTFSDELPQVIMKKCCLTQSSSCVNLRLPVCVKEGVNVHMCLYECVCTPAGPLLTHAEACLSVPSIS